MSDVQPNPPKQPDPVGALGVEASASPALDTGALARVMTTLRFYGRQQQYLDPIGRPCECVWCDGGEQARGLLAEGRWPQAIEDALSFYANRTDEQDMPTCTRDHPCIYCDGGARARGALLALGEDPQALEALIDAAFFFGADGFGHETHSLTLRPAGPLPASTHACSICGSTGEAGSTCEGHLVETGLLVYREDRDETARCGHCGSTGTTYSVCEHEIDGVRYAVTRVDASVVAQMDADGEPFDALPGDATRTGPSPR